MKTERYLWRGSENPVGKKRVPKQNKLVGDRKTEKWVNEQAPRLNDEGKERQRTQTEVRKQR